MATPAQRNDDAPIDAAELAASLAGFAAALAGAVERDPVLRDATARLAALLTRAAAAGTQPAGEAVEAPPAPAPVAPPVRAEEADAAAVESEDTREPIHETVTLRIGGETSVIDVLSGGDEVPVEEPRHAEAPAAPQAWERHHPDLSMVVRRCRLKAEAARWCAQRRSRLSEGASYHTSIRPTDRNLADQAAELESCQLWMLDEFGEAIGDVPFEQIASDYETLATAAEMVDDLTRREEIADVFRDDAYQLLASAQYALRQTLHPYVEVDRDQQDAFSWLRERTRADSVYVSRHMRWDDPAGTPDRDALAREIDGLSDLIQNRHESQRRRRKLMSNLRHKFSSILDRDEEERRAEWRRIDEIVTELLEETGMRPTDVGLRDLLVPALDDLPGDLERSQAFDAVVTNAIRFRDQRRRQQAHAGLDGAAPVPAGPDSIPETIAAVLEQYPDRIVFALNSRSDAAYPYERPAEALRAFVWLATRYHAVRSGVEQVSNRDLDLELRAQCGWRYSRSQSAVTVGQFADWYTCTWDGRTYDIHEHIGRGDAKRQGSNSIRVAFAWCDVTKRIVVGFIGQHQRTRQS